MPQDLMEQIVSLAKRRGFIFPSSEIYGGLSGVYDYGPIGVELKNNLKDIWIHTMTRERDDIVLIDSNILMAPSVWEASGHTGAGFTDPLVECKKCHQRFRQDMAPKKDETDHHIHEFMAPKQFNLLVETRLGTVEGSKTKTYLRGETAQGIYVNFVNVKESTRKSLPFGIAQVGKAFRNEITIGHFLFRLREFEQMEMQFFIHPTEADTWFAYWQKQRMDYYLALGINKDHLRFHEHGKDELAHYAKRAIDIEYKFPFGWKELEGIHNRGDWDLSRHSKFSGKDLSVFDEKTGKRLTPYIIETSTGLDRNLLMFMLESYEAVEGGRTVTTKAVKEVEEVLHFNPRVAPIKAAVFPLVNKDKLPEVSQDIYHDLKKEWHVEYDDSGSIGRRYRRQDEIGTPFCITVDFDTLKDQSVTVRDRDSMKQQRVTIKDLKNYLSQKIE
ncbi:MAG: glycine--tRNA ligase [Patescibacteria group bacterium]